MPDAKSNISAHRWVENIHILLWLLKDACWVLAWKPGAIGMIVPTIAVAIYLLIRNRRHRSETFHNAAVCAWITGNSTWMLGEFYNVELRPVAATLFISGLLLLMVYYLVFFKKDRTAGNT